MWILDHNFIQFFSQLTNPMSYLYSIIMLILLE